MGEDPRWIRIWMRPWSWSGWSLVIETHKQSSVGKWGFSVLTDQILVGASCNNSTIDSFPFIRHQFTYLLPITTTKSIHYSYSILIHPSILIDSILLSFKSIHSLPLIRDPLGNYYYIQSPSIPFLSIPSPLSASSAIIMGTPRTEGECCRGSKSL